MTKNTKGGKHKNQARKHINAANNTMRTLRLAKDNMPEEKYASVVRILGGPMIEVLCEDNVKRLGHIRGKFTGKGKRNNLMTSGSWILVGLRSFETSTARKLDNCDVLEVYEEGDKDRIVQKLGKKNPRIKVLMENDAKYNIDMDIDNIFQEEEDEVEVKMQSTAQTEQTQTFTLSEDVDIDDI